MRLKPAASLRGRITVPGDKSISHRAAIIAAIAHGTSRFENFSTSNDCLATLNCLRALGVTIESTEKSLSIDGVGLGGLRKPSGPLDCGNSGSTMRMLAGVLAAHEFSATLTGDDSLKLRPMRRVIEPLELMGAKISSAESKPPLTITGNTRLRAIDFEPAVASAQVKSCLLFAALHANGTTRVTERRLTRDHTEGLLKFFDVNLETTTSPSGSIQSTLTGPAQPQAREFRIPGDISSAAFFVAAAGLLRGSELWIEHVGLNPTRKRYLSVFQRLGLNIKNEALNEHAAEPSGVITISGEQLKQTPSFQSANRLPADDVSPLIDELPLLAVVGSQLPGGIIVRGARELRYKESDRIAATIKNLRAMKADVDEFEDGFAVRGPQKLQGARLCSYGDHRIAMAFSVAALLAEGESELDDADCVSVSFPEFFTVLESVVER
jgi:3-phosphoshikimate 1-carboxyvinyltransferase